MPADPIRSARHASGTPSSHFQHEAPHSRNISRHSVAGVPERRSLPTLALYGLALVAVLVVGLRWVGGDDAPATQDAAIAVQDAAATPGSGATATPQPGATAAATAAAVIVHVAGAVRRPGVYSLEQGSRIHEAVREAGGATKRADLSALNLAATVQDGRQILVPERAGRGSAAAAATAAAAPSAAGTPAEPIDLNTATLEQLDTLDGVGPATAQKILAYREAHGGFRAVEELDQIPGIGEKRLAALRTQVRIG
jgi:competence protein ComEA